MRARNRISEGKRKYFLPTVLIALLFGVSFMSTRNAEVGVGVQSIVNSDDIADIDFVSGTDSPGDVVKSLFKATLDVNSTLNIDNATVRIYNSTNELVQASSPITSFSGSAYLSLPVSEVSKSETYYLNATALNDTATFSSSTNTYNNRPDYGITEEYSGATVVLSGGEANNTAKHIGLYYQNKVLKDWELYNITEQRPWVMAVLGNN